MTKAATLNIVEEDVVVKAKTKRILAIDLIRGFFLAVILIDHIELYPAGWDIFTGKGRLWVSAAEGFFFLSGLLIGMIYKRRLHMGMKFIFRKMWRRALELYIAGTALTLTFLNWVLLTHHAPIKDVLPNPFPWGHYTGQILLARFTYGWADFLVHFAVLMLIAPIIFYLVARGKWWLAVIAIAAMWFFRGESFNLAWQVIFNLGIIIGFYWQEITVRFRRLTPARRRLVKRTAAAAAAITFIASYASIYLLNLFYYLWGKGDLSQPMQHLTATWGRLNYDMWVYADKWTMGPLRIGLFFLWFTVLYWVVHKYEDRIGRASRGILELLGRNSLFVYILEAFIVFILKMYIIPSRTTFFENFLITTAGLAVLVVVTKFYKSFEAKYFTR